MKKRILSFLLALTMVLGMLPASALSAETAVTEISTAEQFAAMSSTGNYKLTQDITVTTPYSSQFKGTFDGDGHTVTLNLNVTSGNAGLFKETGSGATIQNVVIDATVTSSAGSYPATAGLIGKVSGSTTVKNCGVSGTIANTSSSASYTGGLIGYITSGITTVRNSYSTATVSCGSSYSSAVGGLIGYIYSAKTNVENCYTTGSVTTTSTSTKVGGLLNSYNTSSYSPATVENCYTAATVNASNGYAVGYNYNTTYCTFENCYYDSTVAGDKNVSYNAVASGLTGKTTDELKKLADTLGEDFRADTESPVNGGYPILSWQYFDPNATYTVSFTVEPKEAALTWNGAAQTMADDGKYTFSDVAVGTYDYSVACEAGDYATQSGTVTVKNKAVSTDVKLELNKHTLTFDVTPAGAELTVKSGDDTLTPTTGHTYTVTKGDYTYSASAFGYADATGTVTVDAENKTETVALDAQPAVTVTFAYADGKTDVSNGTLTVKTGERVMTAKADSNGLVYELPVGYSYGWTFKSANYGKQTDTIDLTGTSEAGTKSVTIPMADKTKWEGNDDITEPSKVDGVYQITSGSELAWLAQKVNNASYSDTDKYNAVLCKDIDLDNENWTPIGKQGTYTAYKGTFDGKGYEVKNLKITGNGYNYGLFGVLGSGTVQNLTVSGTVTTTGSNTSTSYGTGGIVGVISDAGTVQNCVSEVTVTGKYNVGGIVGCASGSSYEKTISGCVNLGEVSGSSNVGGIVGQFYGKGSVQNCYNRKAVTGSYNSGGIVGYLYSGSSYYKNAVSNCYSTGTVTGNSDCNAVVGKINNKTYSTVENCFYLSTEGGKTDTNATAKSETELKALVETLGEAFIAAPAGTNDGYPILKWQVPTYTVTFTVSPENAKVAIEGQTGAQNGSQWTFKLPNGTYLYTVSAFGYGDKTDSINVNGAAASETVTLTEAAKKTVTFQVTPANANATVTVTWRGETISPETDGSYKLPDGTYQYSVKAKGYARISNELTISADGETTVSVSLTPSTAWDGSTKENPSGEGTQTSPYEIDSGEALAWLAGVVNKAGSVQPLYCKLTDDIDLGECAFAPIGKDTSHPFSGEFDGQGHTISGLKVENAAYAGLFGVVKDATIKNVVVKGSVSGTGETGGLVGFAQSGTVTIENCGNEAVVTTTGSYVGGLLGKSFAPATIKNSYNTGAVSSTSSGTSVYAGGIAGYAGGSNGKLTVTDCYNTGAVTSTGNTGGILGYDSSTSCGVTNCYSTGTVTSSGKTGALVPNSSTTVTNSYYESGADSHDGAKKVSEASPSLLSALGETSWKTVRGVNDGLPILTWQKDAAASGTVTLAANPQFDREDVVSLEGDETTLPVGTLKWTAVTDATSYTVSLWRSVLKQQKLSEEELAAYKTAQTALKKLDIADENLIIAAMTEAERTALELRDEAVADAQTALQYNTSADVALIKKLLKAEDEAQEARAAYIVSVAKEADLGYYVTELTWVQDIPHVTGTSYDLSTAFAALDEGMYYASVAAETDGQTAYVSMEQAEKVARNQSPYDRMKAVTTPRWDGTIARWDAKDGFTKNQTYQIDLYTVTGSGENRTYTHYKSFTMPGQYTAANLANEFAAEKKYAFRVTALSDSELQGRLGLSDSLVSAYSGVYDPSSVTTPEQKEWVDISTAQQWMELANVEDVPSGGNGSDSKQLVEWTKNYRLTADIDFSTLSAADQAKTKSIGTVTYPFMGEFDGQGYKITGLTLSNNDSGLFWYVGSTGYIHDLTVDSANVLFSDNAAVLVHNNRGLIEKCAVLNTNITADTGAVLGGMVSRNYGIIRSSYVQGGSLTSNTTTATGHAGFVGANEEGGLIENCWTSMEVSTKSAHAGGFVGLCYGGTIRNCFALGDVSADRYSGGFVGRSVWDGNTYENCYAAGVVTVTSEEGNGFIGGNQAWSGFQYDQSEGITNCYYNSATQSAHDYGAVGKSLDEMKTAAFLTALSGSESGVWAQDADKNSGLPYLNGVAVPTNAATTSITVELAIASYNKTTYAFEQMGQSISVTMDSTGNTRLVDLMDEAAEQGKLTYSYATTSTFGRYIHTINDRAVESPDGWMFTINDTLSNVSASLATVKNEDKILWFEGTTENRFQGPTWAELSGTTLAWVDIASVEDLLALANATDAATLGKNYRLTADLDLTGQSFSGIGTADAPFTGVFDGQNHTISNLTITASDKDNVGFFGVIKGATIKNLKLTGVNVTGKNKVGGLVGYAQAVLDSADLSKNIASLIGSCTVSGTVSGTESVGGLIGLNEGRSDKDTLFSIACSVDQCTANVTVTGQVKTGGLVGDNSGTVTKSTAKGAVTAADGSMTGGFAGSSTGAIYESHAEGNVIGKTHTGGFAGSSTGEIKKCYSLGAVTGTDYTGSFAGSITQADTVIGAGQVTVTGTPATGYNGGFAGYLGGTLTGLSNQITIKTAYGNCTQAAGENIKVVGNTSAFSTDSQKTALETMTLANWSAVGSKLYELFGITLSGTDASVEAEKYAAGIAVPADTAANTVLDLLKSGQTANGDITVTYTVDAAYSAYLTGGSALTLVKANDTAATITIPVRQELSSPNGYASRDVKITLSVSGGKQTALMDAIAGSYTDTADQWAAMDMALYAALPGKTIKLTDETKQTLLNTIITSSAGSEASASDRARMELVLRALGVDSGKLYPVNSNTSFSNAAKLAQLLPLSSYDYYSAPWVLLAEQQGNLTLTQTQRQELIDLLKDNMGSDGLFGYEWEGVTYPDMAGSVLSALARFYSSNADAKTVVDTILANLPSAMDATGSFGSANSDAFVIIGLLAVGRDPTQMKAPSGASVVDGLLSYVNTATNRFQFWGTDNDLATEQAFRALAALALYDGQNPCDIYDFSANSVVPGRANGSGASVTPTPPTGTDITVSVTIQTDSGNWMSGKSVTIPGEGATVYHAFVKALEGSGITQVGAESGYVRSMTKNGVTLGEFSGGDNSGWLYKVNGKLPSVGLTACSIEDGDSILWYYTGDWTRDPDAGTMGGTLPTAQDKAAAAKTETLIEDIGTITKDSGPAIAAARAAYDALSDAGKELVGNYALLIAAEKAFAALSGEVTFEDVDAGAYYYEALLWAVKTGLTKGTSATTFSPDMECSRGQMVTFLWRAAGEPRAQNRNHPFLDVDESAYYYEALLWAVENGITQGTSGTTFSPDMECSRGQMVVFLYRGAGSPAVSGKTSFTDVNDGDYFDVAVTWAAEQQITNGTGAGLFSPDMECSRGQMVTFFYRWK